MKLLKVSPQGQITLPKEARELNPVQQYLFEKKGNNIILIPVTIKPVEDELQDFASLANSSDNFWDNDSDDIYQEFYN